MRGFLLPLFHGSHLVEDPGEEARSTALSLQARTCRAPATVFPKQDVHTSVLLDSGASFFPVPRWMFLASLARISFRVCRISLSNADPAHVRIHNRFTTISSPGTPPTELTTMNRTFVGRTREVNVDLTRRSGSGLLS